MKKDQLYYGILKIWIKEKKSTVKNSIKDLLKLEMKNRVRNSTMAKVKNRLWHIFQKQQHGARLDRSRSLWWPK